MNKKILSMALAAFAFTGVSNAYADCDGIYLGLRGGIYRPKLEETKRSSRSFKYGSSNWAFSGAIGYRYEYFRAEIEAILREDASKSDYSNANRLKESIEANSYMFNLYWDLSPYTMVTPYLMGGVGFSKTELSTASAIMPTVSFKKNSAFTWSLGAGISAKVTSRFNVDLGYRYFDMDKLNYARVESHEAYLGLRYVF